MITRDQIEARMLDGRPFTYGGLCAGRMEALRVFGGEVRDGDHDRLIDRSIQRLRRQGKIAFEREGGAVLWSVTKGPSQ